MASSASASFPQVPASDVQGALAAIEEHGGVVLLNAITPARAAALAEAALAAPNVIPGVKNWCEPVRRCGVPCNGHAMGNRSTGCACGRGQAHYVGTA